MLESAASQGGSALRMGINGYLPSLNRAVFSCFIVLVRLHNAFFAVHHKGTVHHYWLSKRLSGKKNDQGTANQSSRTVRLQIVNTDGQSTTATLQIIRRQLPYIAQVLTTRVFCDVGTSDSWWEFYGWNCRTTGE